MKRLLSILLVLCLCLPAALAEYDIDNPPADYNSISASHAIWAYFGSSKFGSPGVFDVEDENLKYRKTVWVYGTGDPYSDVFAYWRLTSIFDLGHLDNMLVCYCLNFGGVQDKVLMFSVTAEQIEYIESLTSRYYYYTAPWLYFDILYAKDSVFPELAMHVITQ